MPVAGGGSCGVCICNATTGMSPFCKASHADFRHGQKGKEETMGEKTMMS